MQKKKQRGKKKEVNFPLAIDELEKVLKNEFHNNEDLIFSTYNHRGKKMAVFCISYLVDTNKLETQIIDPLLKKKVAWTNEDLLNEIPLESGSTTDKFEDVLYKLINGNAFIYIEGENATVTYNLLKKEKRNLEKAETESLVLGPKIAFTESIITNMNIVRFRIRSKDLVIEEIVIGKTIPHEVRLIYMKSIANEADVNTMRQRLLDLDVDEIEDSIVLKQYVEDNELNIFPQFDSTELPDRFTYAITKGKVGVLVENSPTGFLAPSTLFSFLESTEDLYMRWQGGSFLLFIRFMALFFSILVTPLYVAILTYQYGIIPTHLMITLGQSRAAVLFPPVIEALLLEFLIELLREAGARLPTKVGQTMGIVGGIVIGQAAVEAGLTSNILIIVTAMSAVSSFTTPSYLLGTSIRIIRFPLILLAGMFGLFGIMIGVCFLIIHALRLTSLGRPYLIPLYPLRLQDFNKVFFRLPLNKNAKRAKSYRPKKLFRFSVKEASQKKDIDE